MKIAVMMIVMSHAINVSLYESENTKSERFVDKSVINKIVTQEEVDIFRVVEITTISQLN
jgi:hypothetical protein